MNFLTKWFTPALRKRVARELYISRSMLMDVEGQLESLQAQKSCLNRRIARLTKLEKKQ